MFHESANGFLVLTTGMNVLTDYKRSSYKRLCDETRYSLIHSKPESDQSYPIWDPWLMSLTEEMKFKLTLPKASTISFSVWRMQRSFYRLQPPQNNQNILLIITFDRSVRHNFRFHPPGRKIKQPSKTRQRPAPREAHTEYWSKFKIASFWLACWSIQP